MPYLAASFFGLNNIDDELGKHFFMDLTDEKLIAENYANAFGITRDALYKQYEKSKGENF